MIITILDMENRSSELHGAVVGDSDRLRHLLQKAQLRPPFFCKLMGENGFCLDIGIGNVGCVQFCRTDGIPPYLTPVRIGQADPGYEVYVAAGTGTQVEKRFCLPYDDVIRIAVYFMENGTICPLFQWEHVS